MTEHRTILVPGENQEGESRKDSLIERVVDSFDLKSFSVPPVPQDLKIPPKKFGDGTPSVPTPKASPETQTELPIEQMSMAEPVLDLEPESRPVPPPACAEPVVAIPEAIVEPVCFDGEKHPVDREHLREQGLIVPEGSVTALLEEFRIVKRQLLLQAQDLHRQGSGAAAQRVLVSSPHPGEGKTYCTVNLALSIAAEKESEVLLVDADFAKPSILSVLGLPGGPGLMDALVDPSADVARFVLDTDIPGLHVLPAGNATNTDSEYLTSSRTGRVLDRLTEGMPHRMVIFDSPPALAASPAAELARYAGQVLMIAQADRTGQRALEDAISLLSGCPNIQLLLNATSFSPSGRRFGSYYGYGG